MCKQHKVLAIDLRFASGELPTLGYKTGYLPLATCIFILFVPELHRRLF